MNMADFTDQLQALQEIADRQQAEQNAQAKAAKKQNRQEQIEAGACNVVPFPKRTKEPFRSELTIEQSSLFIANRYRKKFFSREWEIKNPDGEPLLRRLTVGKVHQDDEPRGVLRQVHQDVFYRLLQLWGEHGYGLGTYDEKTYGSFTTTVYRLVTALRNNKSVREYRRVQTLLRDLASIPVVIETINRLSRRKDRQEFTLLSEVNWNELGIDERTNLPEKEGKSEVTILFSSMVTEGFLDKHYKTLLGEPYRSLGSKTRRQRGELARLLYPYLDAQLAIKTNFHIKLQSLAERFGLTRHRKMSYRKRQFMSAVNMLNGKLIKSEDYVLKVSLRESSEEDDLILIAKREPNRQLRLFKEEDC